MSDRPTPEAWAAFDEARAGVSTAPFGEAVDVPDWMRTIENMYEFFNQSAAAWDGVFGVGSHPIVHQRMAEQITPTDAPLRLLDIGCGTGLELTPILGRIPNARVTCQDLAPKMLDRVKSKFADRLDRFDFQVGSYLDLDLPEQTYDFAVAALTLHHLPPEQKLVVLKNLRRWLKPDGVFLLGDQSSSPRREREILDMYQNYITGLPGGDRGDWNFDVTLSPDAEIALMKEAGFANVEMVWTDRDDEVDQGFAVFVARP